MYQAKKTMVVGQRAQPIRKRNLHSNLTPIFIVGQYKCGSTWLLNLLSAHPQVVGAAEIDIVRAACDFDGMSPRLAPTADRLHRFFDGSGWCAYHDGTRWRDRDVVMRLGLGERPTTAPGNPNLPQMFHNLSPDVAMELFRRIQSAERPEQAMDAFLDALRSHSAQLMREHSARPVTHLVLKGCDMVAVFDVLQSWKPSAKKLVITRDGRDAAISARQFQSLLRELDAPFRDNVDRDYWSELSAWANRTDRVIEYARRDELRIIRYEDLSRDFAGTIRPVLSWLGLDDSTEVLNHIEHQASFQVMTGRTRGSESRHFFRRGQVGEWIE